MSVNRRIYGRIVLIILVSLIVVDAALYGIRSHFRNALLVQDPRLFFRDGNSKKLLPTESGFGRDGSFVVRTPDSRTSGLVVRYASRTCHWCQQDRPYWDALAREAIKRHYSVVILTPNAASEYSKGGISPPYTKQISFVNLQWLSDLRLLATPTTLIEDRDNTVVWGHEGAMTNEDEKQALTFLKDAHV